MSLAILFSRARSGIDAPLVTIEIHLSNGLPSLSIVGLPELAVKESKDRVRGALLNSRFEFPNRRITVNMAPADLPKEGGRFDLPIALGVLAASGQIPIKALENHEFLGELALTGEIRPVRGALPAALKAREAGRCLVVPRDNAEEAARVTGLEVLAASHLLEVCEHLHGTRALPIQPPATHSATPSQGPDLADVRGQIQAKRAIEVAAAGGHNLLFLGPPGTGKSMLASRLPGILPPMSDAEALAAAAVLSVSEPGFDARTWGVRPFRAPHHSASAVALVGGGSDPRPGEVSLAHCGVLFLDELPEFERKVLEVLREPLESGQILISRAARQAQFPAQFQLIAAMNPCPCGYLGDPNGQCRCSTDQVARYRSRLSGPLLDRIDLHVEVPRLPAEDLMSGPQAPVAETSAVVRERVTLARERQIRRQGRSNHLLAPRSIENHCRVDDAGKKLLQQAISRLGLSARAYHRVLKVARTIADLGGAETVGLAHLSEAISYRRLDRR
ncbi:putative magnesium chelatase YifB [Gammaproteobacteria bacterium]